MIFPDYWQEFTDIIPESERDDLIAAYHTRVHGPDRNVRETAAVSWSKWAGRLVTYLLPGADYTPGDVDKTVRDVLIETHYAKHRYFIDDNRILDNAALLPSVPIRIIHGRRDLTCTLDASWSLHRALPDSELVIVKEGGHLAGEPVMVDALVTATDDMAKRLS